MPRLGFHWEDDFNSGWLDIPSPLSFLLHVTYKNAPVLPQGPWACRLRDVFK